MRLALIKCHGSGNDFPLIDARGLAVAVVAWPGDARALADRRGPVGGDGLLLLTEGDATHAFGMRMFNPDGTEAEACLNGLRCVARLGFERRGPATSLARTFERGVGLTDSCGSAMAASAHVACLLGHARFGESLTILNKGGLVRAEAGGDGMVSLSGNATIEWEGSAEIDPARGIAGAETIAGHHNDEIAAWARVAEAAGAA